MTEQVVWLTGARNQRTLADDYVRGLHSKIPVCCIEFYVHHASVWSPRLRLFYSRVVHARCVEMDATGAGYIACPACVRDGAFVQVHQCQESCRRTLGNSVWWSEGMDRDEAINQWFLGKGASDE